MSANEKQNRDDILNQAKQLMDKFDEVISLPTEIDGDMFEGDGLIPEIDDFGDLGIALESAQNASTMKKQKRLDDMKERAAKKRKNIYDVKKEKGVRPGKQSKYPSRGDEFISTEKRAIHVVMTTNNDDGGELYKEGADICPRLKKGSAHFGKACKKNAFELLNEAQDKMAEYRGDDPNLAVPWVIISNDTSVIADPFLVTRLDSLLEGTGIAAPYGYGKIRTSGRWYDITPSDQSAIFGQYAQGSIEDVDWDFVVGREYKQSPKYRILIAHGPFIAVRGSLFMHMDFKEAAKKYTRGFTHYMAEISMQAMKLGYAAASIKSMSIQYDSIDNYKNSKEFELDQKYFTSKWQGDLPNAIPSLRVQEPQQPQQPQRLQIPTRESARARIQQRPQPRRR